jgi:hypothetical protein
MPEWAKFYLNTLMHSVVLFSLLTGLFLAYISKQEQKAFQNEIKNGLSSFLAPAVASGTPLHDVLADVLTDSALVNLRGDFNVTEFYVDEGNTRQKIEAATIIVLLSVSFLGTYVCLVLSGGYCGEFWSLAFENICTFAVVGVIEYFFFTKVASKFVPVAPSYFLTTLKGHVVDQISRYIYTEQQLAAGGFEAVAQAFT